MLNSTSGQPSLDREVQNVLERFVAASLSTPPNREEELGRLVISLIALVRCVQRLHQFRSTGDDVLPFIDALQQVSV